MDIHLGSRVAGHGTLRAPWRPNVERGLPSGIPSRHLAVIAGICLALVTATRLPLLPQHLYSFDSVNMALALSDFDPARHQPQPPGYPLFVAEARIVNLALDNPEAT